MAWEPFLPVMSVRFFRFSLQAVPVEPAAKSLLPFRRAQRPASTRDLIKEGLWPDGMLCRFLGLLGFEDQ